MMCGGFACSKNALAFLNILFLLVSFLLIGVASYAKAAAIVTSIGIAGGVIASGLFLFLVSLLGLYAGAKHHQVLLFFYIAILFLLFLIQFSVSVACLVLSETQISNSIANVWPKASNESKYDVQKNFGCCGWNKTELEANHEYCVTHNFCEYGVDTSTVSTGKPCQPCSDLLPESVTAVLEATGGISLFFSFVEMIGVWLALRYRNQKDPSANPSQFL